MRIPSPVLACVLGCLSLGKDFRIIFRNLVTLRRCDFAFDKDNAFPMIELLQHAIVVLQSFEWRASSPSATQRTCSIFHKFADLSRWVSLGPVGRVACFVTHGARDGMLHDDVHDSELCFNRQNDI